MTTKKTGLELLRAPFEKHQISKLPKPTKKQTDDLKLDFKIGIRCKECGGWHHKDVIHLDYVGHAALTDRLLDVDPQWSWEPLSFKDGLPQLDSLGGLWIKLTILGVTRMGYGHADGKSGGDAVKEMIGDALRNAAMRFGAALDLWHKGDLHLPDESETQEEKITKKLINVKTALEGAITESEQTSSVANLGDYQMSCGGPKVKGKKLSEIETSELQGSIKYFKSTGELKGHVKVSIHNAEMYLKNKENQPPTLSSNDKVPF